MKKIHIPDALSEALLEILLSALLFGIGLGFYALLGGTERAWEDMEHTMAVGAIGIAAVFGIVALAMRFLKKRGIIAVKRDTSPEGMVEFFTARVEGYDEHMLKEVEGCAEGYRLMAKTLPEGINTLLDLGCGTGLELDEILLRFPRLMVTGIDLSPAMLARLREKHADKSITLVEDDYFSFPLGEGVYDAAVSFETLHHFPREKKEGLYRRVYDALVDDGVYIECDYMVRTNVEEEHLALEAARLRREAGVGEDELLHIDTPLSVEHQTEALLAAGFREVREVFSMGGTVMLVAKKKAS